MSHVILEKSVKQQASSAQIHTPMIFLGQITNIACFFLIRVKKAKYLEDSCKVGPNLFEKLTLC